MYTRHICVSANESIIDSSAESSGLSEILSDISEMCSAEGKKVITASKKSSTGHFMAGSYCGFLCLVNGTLIEILPCTEGGIPNARKALCEEFCKRCGHTFSLSDFEPDRNFMEYFISVFAGETMKIIKSGVLSNYTSREENMKSVQGTILFSENIRRNLVHRERIYVRHDVFTPDRAENRIIKKAASMLNKITADPHSSHLLKESRSFLDEVRTPRNITAEFSKCINTRNTQKYNTTLSICRMLFDKNEDTFFAGKHILCAQIYKLP